MSPAVSEHKLHTCMHTHARTHVCTHARTHARTHTQADSSQSNNIVVKVTNNDIVITIKYTTFSPTI